MKLEHIEIAHWAGLGGVSYLPLEFRPELEEVDVPLDADKKDVSEPLKEQKEADLSVRS